MIEEKKKYEKLKIQAPGTTFSNLSDEVRPEGGHGKCFRFGHSRKCTMELTSALPKFGWMGTFGAIIEQKNEKTSQKRTVTDVVPMSLLSGVFVYEGVLVVGSATQVHDPHVSTIIDYRQRVCPLSPSPPCFATKCLMSCCCLFSHEL